MTSIKRRLALALKQFPCARQVLPAPLRISICGAVLGRSRGPVRPTGRGALAFAFLVFASSPGSYAYAATAEVLGSAAAPASPSASWIPVLGSAASNFEALADPASSRLSGVLGQIEFETALRPQSGAANLLAAELPAQANTPEKLAALSEPARALLLSRAVAAASAHLSAQAASLIKKFSARDAKPSAADQKAFARIAPLWFFLPADQGQAVRKIAQEQAERGPLQKARRMARAFAGKFSAQLSSVGPIAPETRAAAKIMYARLRPALARAPGDEDSSVQAVLAPLALDSLRQASRSIAERGGKKTAIWTSILEKSSVLNGHRRFFGALADPTIVKALRKDGRWTELVSALSLSAAQELALQNDANAIETLRQAGSNYDLRLPIPAWHPLAGRFETVADSLSSYGQPEEESLGRGLRLGRILGIPVVIRWGALVAVAAIAAQIFAFPMWSIPHASKSLLALSSAASAVLLYGSVLAHEFGHGLMARAVGINTHRITLNIMGGVAFVDHASRRPLKDFLIAFAGPAVNIALSAACFLPALLFHLRVPPFAVATLIPFISLNVCLAALNMLPILPMDGGLMLRSVLTAIWRDNYRAERAAEKLAWLVGVASLAAGAVFLMAGRPSIAMAVVFLGAIGLVPHPLAHPGTTLVPQKRKR